MRSWHDAGRLVTLYRRRNEHLRRTIADLTRLREDGRAADRQLADQQAHLEVLMDEQREQGRGAMTRAALFSARRHLAVLLRQHKLVTLERERLAREDAVLAGRERGERERLQQGERKRNKYRVWMRQQRRLARLAAERAAAGEIGERLPWSIR